MRGKERLSASIDADLLTAARAAVAEGRAQSVSDWVSDALRRQAERDRRLAALRDYLSAYEREHGQITEEEMGAAARDTAARAVVVRGSGRGEALRPT